MKIKTNSAAWQILRYLKTGISEITNLDAVRITGKSSAPRTMRKLQENGLVKSRWNNSDHDFKYYSLGEQS